MDVAQAERAAGRANASRGLATVLTCAPGDEVRTKCLLIQGSSATVGVWNEMIRMSRERSRASSSTGGVPARNAVERAYLVPATGTK
jgi:hypothetical protein